MRFHCVIILKVIIVKMPRVRVRQGKPGRNGRDTMRFQRVIISLESRILLEIRVTARGVAGSEIVALHAARGCVSRPWTVQTRISVKGGDTEAKPRPEPQRLE